MTDPFPSEEFDDWAANYDQSVANTQSFPFTGYEDVLDKVVELAAPQPSIQVLDLGTGTGNLAVRFDALGCAIWGTDFSTTMLAKAKIKLPQAKFFQADLRCSWPTELERRFDYIVSAYVFHHFELDKKVKIIETLVRKNLKSSGKLIIADIAFQNQHALETIKRDAGEEWEEEYYWLADESETALAKVELTATFHQVSNCAGVFEITDLQKGRT